MRDKYVCKVYITGLDMMCLDILDFEADVSESKNSEEEEGEPADFLSLYLGARVRPL